MFERIKDCAHLKHLVW